MFVTGEVMNLDMNAISALMQMFAGKGREPSREQYPPREQTAAQSPFAAQNGLGEKADFSQKPKADPLAGILGMFSGQATDASPIMPMLMNMLKRPAAQPSGSVSGEKPTPEPEQERQKDGKTNKSAAPDVSFEGAFQSAGKFAPISFAGYALISALNLLSNHRD